MNRKEGSGRPRLIKAEENTYLIKELICSQEEAPHTHLAPPKIAEQTGISCSPNLCSKNLCQFKAVKTPEMNDGCRNRRYAHAIALAEKFERNTRMIETTV